VCTVSVTAIIPALNEEESIGQVLAAVPAGVVSEILVVDGGSSDSTVAVAQAGGARVIHEPRRGYGRACATGVAAARGDTVVFLDTDGADDPTQIPDLLAPLQGNRADMVLGSRLAGEIAPGAMPYHSSPKQAHCTSRIVGQYNKWPPNGQIHTVEPMNQAQSRE